MRRAMLVGLFVACAMAFASAQVVVGVDGFATMRGLGIWPAPAWPPLIVTPSIHLATELGPPFGITDHGRAGASYENSAAIAPEPTTQTVPVLNNPGAFVIRGFHPQAQREIVEGHEMMLGRERMAEHMETMHEGGGPASGTMVVFSARQPLGTSVTGRQQPPRPAVHTYTNDDMQRLEQQGHLSIIGKQRG